mmetsp:Transcript_133352/g.231377  ORF Transcript_133352/g.231377 Transcript_133352/m.231377 type:complete len:372 (-) Transcript_133352:260-1375(-)
METTFLKGHKASVVGLDLSLDGRHLLSCSEDNTCRLWDPEARRGLRCLIGDGQPITHAVFSPTMEHLIFTLSGPNIRVYDLRNPGIVLKDALLTTSLEIEDDGELNQMSMRSDGKAFCCASDDGSIYQFSLQGSDTDGTLALQSEDTLPLHANVCSVVRYRYGGGYPMSNEILTGGYDCCMFHLDAIEGKWHNTLNLAESSHQKKKWVNPPFLHSLDVSRTGSHAALGLGNGNIQVIGLEDGDLNADFQAHGNAIGCVAWHGSGTTRLWSGGNDHLICFWDMSVYTECSGSDLPAVGSSEDEDPQIEASALMETGEAAEGDDLEEDEPPPLLINIEHPHGVNSLAAAPSTSPLRLYVADESNHISCYTIMQ